MDEKHTKKCVVCLWHVLVRSNLRRFCFRISPIMEKFNQEYKSILINMKA